VHFRYFFAAVLLNQAGAPIPIVPYLVTAGVLFRSCGNGMLLANWVAVDAALVADAISYGLGRWRGRGVLLALTRLATSGLEALRLLRSMICSSQAWRFSLRATEF